MLDRSARLPDTLERRLSFGECRLRLAPGVSQPMDQFVEAVMSLERTLYVSAHFAQPEHVRVEEAARAFHRRREGGCL